MSEDFYSDDPIEEKTSGKFQAKFLTTGVVIFASIFFFQSTLASNITLNSGTTIEFGQGVSQAVACSGNTSLTLTAFSSFTNQANGGGNHYLSSVKVTGIPTDCRRADFTFNAYANTGNSPLALFNSTSTKAVVYDNNDTFEVGIGGSGLSVTTNSPSSFTLTFNTPVALSSTISKITIQSSVHSPKPCSEGGDCVIGERGPGNGIVFYISQTPFTASNATCNTNCRYLEVAPAGWNNGGVVADDPDLKISSDTSNLSGMSLAPSVSSQSGRAGELENWKIGMGSSNTYYFMTASGSHTADTGFAARAAWNYAGTDSSAGQWYIPSVNEYNELCKYAWGQTTGNPTVACSGTGTFKTTAAAGTDLGGFRNNQYVTSSEVNSGTITIFRFSDSSVFAQQKIYGEYNRVIRAF